jgi:hypothetical protein
VEVRRGIRCLFWRQRCAGWLINEQVVPWWQVLFLCSLCRVCILVCACSCTFTRVCVLVCVCAAAFVLLRSQYYI